jgi:1-acyl-sn-glycerol-3-phosphate acyltransferase
MRRISGVRPEDRSILRRLARQTLAILGVRVVRGGRGGPAPRPVLVVANHVSWLDVYALQAGQGGRAVAKREVRDWPIAGAIVRGSPRDAARVKDAVAAALRAGERVVVFPEGTTSDGAGVGRFYPDVGRVAAAGAAAAAGRRADLGAARAPGRAHAAWARGRDASFHRDGHGARRSSRTAPRSDAAGRMTRAGSGGVQGP